MWCTENLKMSYDYINLGETQENMFVTNAGEISGMESAVIFESTNRKILYKTR